MVVLGIARVRDDGSKYFYQNRKEVVYMPVSICDDALFSTFFYWCLYYTARIPRIKEKVE